jgi:thiol-disulfide isomerase/thioredoxin
MNRALLAFVALSATAAAPAFQPLDEAGFRKLVESHKGKVVAYEFWATWCVPCQAEVPRLAELHRKFRSRGFEVVTISSDFPERETAAAHFLEKSGVAGAAYRKQARDDDRFYDSVQPEWGGALPALFLYDRGGRRVRSFIGETDPAIIETAIRKLL